LWEKAAQAGACCIPDCSLSECSTKFGQGMI
jgi:hypothetical protein